MEVLNVFFFGPLLKKHCSLTDVVNPRSKGSYYSETTVCKQIVFSSCFNTTFSTHAEVSNSINFEYLTSVCVFKAQTPRETDTCKEGT